MIPATSDRVVRDLKKERRKTPSRSVFAERLLRDVSAATGLAPGVTCAHHWTDRNVKGEERHPRVLPRFLRSL